MSFGKKDSKTIKGIAILFLLFYHLFFHRDVYADFDVEFLLNPKYVAWFASFGNICVALFLFISAYGISVSLQNPERNRLDNFEIAKNSLKRALILILHFFAMYCSIWIIWFSKLSYTVAYGDGKQSILFAITDALGLAEIFDTPTICMTWWYMELAIFCIIVVPIFQIVYHKIGILLLGLLLFVPCLVSLDMNLYKYVFVIGIGISAANGNWVNRAKEFNLPKILKVCLAIVSMIATFLIRSNAIVEDYYAFFTEGFIAFIWVVGILILFGNVPIITKALQFVGKHSMNIFFFHTFIYFILYRDKIYGLKYASLIFAVVFGISLIYSVCIEFIKEKTGFNKMIKKIKGENNE